MQTRQQRENERRERNEQLAQMPITHLAAGSIHVGKRLRAYDAAAVEELKADIAKRGLLHPLIVRRLNNNLPELICGYHRLEAVKSLGWDGVPCRVIEADDHTAQEFEIVENLRRKELSSDERAAHIAQLGALIKTQGGEKLSDAESLPGKRGGGRGKKGTIQKVAEASGLSQQTVRRDMDKASEAIGEPIDLEPRQRRRAEGEGGQSQGGGQGSESQGR